LRRLFLLVAALIVYGSLFPWKFHPLDPRLHVWAQMLVNVPDHLDRWFFKDLLVNVILYVPLGFTGALAFARPRWKSWLIPIAFGVALSGAMEYAQLYTYARTASAFDLLTNATGAVLGTVIGHWVHFAWRVRPKWRSKPDEVMILALFLCWQLYPFFPVSGRTALYAHLAALPQFDWLDAATALVGWTGAGIAARNLLPGRRVWWLAMLFLLRPLVLSRSLTSAEIAGALVALLLVSRVPIPAKVAAAAAGGLLLLRELMPLHFSGTATSFEWVPFVATLSGDWLRASEVLVDKLYLVALPVWLACQAGVSLWLAAGTTAVVLFALELLQTHLPGRTPESTDAVLALVAGLLLELAYRRRSAMR
jgi:VanZ family protein